MQIHITGHHPLEVTEAMKLKITEKLSKLSHYFNNIIDIHVTLSIEHYEHKAVAHANLAKTEVSAHAHSKDMYATIDALFDKLKVQITKHKEKMKDHDEDGTLL